MDVDQKTKQQISDSYSDDDLFVLMSYKNEDEAEAKAAFRSFHDRYSKLLWTLCEKVCKSMEAIHGMDLAKCVFNNTLIKIYYYPTYDSRKGKLSTWMSRIAHNELIEISKECNFFRDSSVVSLNEAITESVQDIEEEDLEYEIPERKILHDALNKLSERDYEILWTCLLHQDGKKHLPDEVLYELCSRFSTTSDNIRQIKKRALEKVKAHCLQNSTLTQSKNNKL